MNRLSACIIVRDERHQLADCLASVAFCDEVVVVDSGSRDGTQQLARDLGARVVEHPWRGFGAQRNVGLDHASGEWVLEIDADERVSPALRDEIEAFLAAAPPDIDLVVLPLRDRFLGRPLRAASKYPNYRHRLFRRGALRHEEGRTVHEGLVADRPTWPLNAPLEHQLAAGWREALADAWIYARLEAAQAPRPRLRDLTLRPAVKCVYRLFVYGGWRDGWRGALKIALDCGSDVLVAALTLLRGEHPQGRQGHFGRTDRRAGPGRLVALARGPEASARAARWLRAAQAAGADVALICDAPRAIGDAGPRVRALPRFDPVAVLRALDAEAQVRDIDAIVLEGCAARRLARLLPRPLRGPGGPLNPADVKPHDAERRVRERAR